MQLYVTLIALILVSAIAFWRKGPALFMAVIFMVLSGVALMLGLNWYDTYVNELGLAVSLGLLLYSLVCIGGAFGAIFWTGGDNV